MLIVETAAEIAATAVFAETAEFTETAFPALAPSPCSQPLFPALVASSVDEKTNRKRERCLDESGTE